MKYSLIIITALIISLPLFASKNEVASNHKALFGLNDTVFFDLDQALITTTTGTSFIDIPVYIKGASPVNSLDFWFKFDETKLTYFSTISALSALDTYSNFNTNDRYLRNTTSGPSSSYQLANNLTLIYIRFQLKSSCTQVFTTDFTNITALTNGQLCQTKFITSKQNPSNLELTTGLICSATTTGFTFPATVAGRTISDYNWNFGNGVTSKLQNPFVKFDSPGNFAISLFIQTNEGCSYTINKNIVVNETPKAKFNSTIDCTKDSVFFINTSTLSSGTITTNSWNFGDQSSASTKNTRHNYVVSGTYTVSLNVSSALGCSNKKDTTIVINKPNTDFATDGGCAGNSVSFFDSTKIVTGTLTKWTWDFGDGTTSSLQNPSHIFSTPGTYVVKLIARNSFGCNGIRTKEIVVNDKPNVQFTADKISGCAPLSVGFDNLTTTEPSSAYFWDFGDGEISYSKTPSHLFEKEGVFTVKQIVTTPGGCSDTLVRTGYITVLSSPKVNFSYSAGCVNTTISFQDSTKMTVGTITGWDWDFGDGQVSTTKNPKHIYKNTGSYAVHLNVTNSLGCSGNFVKQVFINEKPIAQFSTPDLGGCAPFLASFVNQSTTANLSSYFWRFGDDSTSTETNPSHNYLKSKAYTVSLVVTAPGGCSDSISKNAYINVSNAIQVAFNDSIHCSGLPTMFTDKSTISSGTITSWDWNFGNGNFSNLQNPSYVYITPGTYTVTLNVATNEGCSSTLTKQLIVDLQPKVDFKVDQELGCIPFVVTFTDQSIAPSNAVYNWTFGDGKKAASKDTIYTYSQIGNYTISHSITTAQGCKDSISKINFIQTQTPPVAAFTSSKDVATIGNSSIDFFSGSSNYSTLNWDFGDFYASQLANPTHLYLDTGAYKVCLTAESSYACTNTVCDTITINGTEVIALPNAFSPNGDKNNDVFKVRGGPFNTFSFKVLNEWGNVLFETSNSEQGWDGTFNGKQQPVGVYEYQVVGTTSDDKPFELYGIVNLTR